MLKKHLTQYTIYDNNTQQSGNRGNIPQHNKCHIWETYSQHHTQRAKTKSFPPKIGHKMRVSTFTTSIQHSIGNYGHSDQTRKRSKRHPNWKGGSKTVIVCRWHDSIHRKPQRFHQETTWTNKRTRQNSGIQSQYSEIEGIFVHQQWNIRNRNQGKNPICYSNMKNKLPGNKPNQRSKRPAFRKLHNAEERN